MPNWCEGTIKVRGKRDKVKDFLVNGVRKYNYNFDTHENELVPDGVYVHDYDWGTEISYNDGSYIEGTYRAFVDDCTVYLENDRDEMCVCMPFRQAWSIDAADFDKLKDSWDVDFRLYGVDCGMGFSMEVIAERGKDVVSTYEDFAEYEDFIWECPFPRLGG